MTASTNLAGPVEATRNQLDTLFRARAGTRAQTQGETVMRLGSSSRRLLSRGEVLGLRGMHPENPNDGDQFIVKLKPRRTRAEILIEIAQRVAEIEDFDETPSRRTS